jgi:hypothetical protein
MLRPNDMADPCQWMHDQQMQQHQGYPAAMMGGNAQQAPGRCNMIPAQPCSATQAGAIHSVHSQVRLLTDSRAGDREERVEVTTRYLAVEAEEEEGWGWMEATLLEVSTRPVWQSWMEEQVAVKVVSVRVALCGVHQMGA